MFDARDILVYFSDKTCCGKEVNTSVTVGREDYRITLVCDWFEKMYLIIPEKLEFDISTTLLHILDDFRKSYREAML